MQRDPTLAIPHYFADLPDPRLGRLCRHELLDIIVISICAVICGQHAWTDIAFYAQDHSDWLKTFLRLPGGIPSHDTFRHVFSRLDPAAFQRCFAAWVAALSEAADLTHIAIDGKTLKGSLDRAHDTAPLHLVSAWASAAHLTLGQVAVADKSNEITAIPRLLSILDVTGAIVTIDAMGCQKEIAAKIREGGADYVLAVKDNQPRLLEDVQAAVSEYLERADWDLDRDCVQTVDAGHGRREMRTYLVVNDLSKVRDRDLWKDLRGVCLVLRERTVGGETTSEAQYYIGSLGSGAADYARGIRGHWGIENNCHWVLDVLYREDRSRSRAEHGAENLAWLRRMALSLLKNDTTCERSMKAKSVKALGDHKFLLQLLSRVSGEKECT